MNLLYVLERLSANGGVETVTRTLATALQERGHKVVLFAADLQSNCNLAETVRKLHELLLEENIQLIINQQNQLPAYTRLCHQARKGTPAKLVNCHHYSLLMMPEARTGRITRHLPLWVVRSIKTWIGLHIIYWTCSVCDRMVFLSPTFIEQYKDLMPRKKTDRMRAITNPLTYPIAPEIDFSKKQKTLLFVGRIVENEKRISFILKLWEKICEKSDLAEWQLKIVGDGPDLAQAKDWAKALPRVSFEGRQPSLPYFQEASILLLASAPDFEGFGMVLAEAQSQGCVPVVMSHYLALADVVQDGQNGFCILNDDMNEFVKKTETLMRNEMLRLQMAANGLQSCRKFEPGKIVDEWEALFREVLCPA
jgi:glycosyltransferase involved in cell wall biosynthesis